MSDLYRFAHYGAVIATIPLGLLRGCDRKSDIATTSVSRRRKNRYRHTNAPAGRVVIHVLYKKILAWSMPDPYRFALQYYQSLPPGSFTCDAHSGPSPYRLRPRSSAPSSPGTEAWRSISEFSLFLDPSSMNALPHRFAWQHYQYLPPSTYASQSAGSNNCEQKTEKRNTEFM